MALKFVCAIIWLGSLLFVGHADKGKIEVPEAIIQRIYDLVEKGRANTEFPYNFAQYNASTEGSYRNDIKFNFVGGPIQTALRWLISVSDLNNYVPLWISNVLMEAHIYGKAPSPSEEQLIATIEFCNNFKDPNKPQNSSIKMFWPYVVDNHKYITTQVGLIEIINAARKFSTNAVEDQQIFNDKNIINAMQFLNKMSSVITGPKNLIGDSIMRIIQDLKNWVPVGDADETSAWLGLGSLIKMYEHEFPQSRDRWIQYNPNIQSMFDALKKNAYRPFSDDPRVNTMKTNIYYAIRHFLDEAKNAGKDLALFTLSFPNYDDNVADPTKQQTNTFVNSFDVAVGASTISSTTMAILSGLAGPELLEDPELNGIYQNTSALITYLINSNFTDRPDLAFSYFLSRYLCYWMVAKTVSLMESYKRKQGLPVKVMEDVYNDLKQALEGEATKFVLENAKQNDDGSLYFDDFLGNGDVTEDNTPIVRGEDRIFTTAMAANFLMYTWLSFDMTSKESQWKANTPESVKKTVEGCILWLTRNTLQGRFKPWNAFFCNAQDSTLRYPANLFLELDEPTSINLRTTMQLAVGMRGYVPKTEYEAMINAKQFGKPVPRIFNGFNDPEHGNMLFWSSEPFTYSVTLLALSRYREIKDTK